MFKNLQNGIVKLFFTQELYLSTYPSMYWASKDHKRNSPLKSIQSITHLLK